MKGFVRPAAGVLTILLCLGTGASLGGPGGLERTLFKDLPPADPAREIVRTVLDSPFYSMRAGFPAKAWAAEGFRDAWERARSYFPGKTYFVVPGTHFMTHGFGPDGKLFMEVHESAYLTLCVENRRTFTAGAVVDEYGRMRGRTDLREAAAFREKTGRLEPFFLDAPGNGALRKALGETVYAGFIGKLREENYPMLAGGLMHEGIHAGLDDAVVARLRADFEAETDSGPMGRAAGLHGRDRLSRTLLRMGRERSRRGVEPDRRGARTARIFQEAAEAPPRRGPGGIRKDPGRSVRRSRARPPADARDLAVGPAYRGPARELPRRLRPGPAARRGRRARSRPWSATPDASSAPPARPSRRRSSPSATSKGRWTSGANGRRAAVPFRRRSPTRRPWSKGPRRSPGRTRRPTGPVPL
ncbi:MAG: hypothetical protein M0C28_25120 [Candidatus Moduliflexus flocculans]|nr:hypothetical protein [Candidatus Moduliflexus flocculans]